MEQLPVKKKIQITWKYIETKGRRTSLYVRQC